MNWIDIIVLIPFCWYAYKGLKNGVLQEIISLAARQQKFIQGLKAALIRIDNKTYGIDRITGKLIPAERLRAVPHATLSVESKQLEKKLK